MTPYWQRKFTTAADPDDMPTTRRFSRTLQEAFPISEGYRDAIERPREPHMLRRVSETTCWVLGVSMLVWLVWAALHAPL